MPVRPSRLWKELPIEKRIAVADAFWRDDQGPEQQAEATVVLARRLNFRAKSLSALPIERRARHLANVSDLSDTVAGRALVAYHFTSERPMMTTFLDALGIAHEEGLITAEEVAAPDSKTLATAVETLRVAFPSDAVDLYLRTLVALDGDTWSGLDALLPASS